MGSSKGIFHILVADDDPVALRLLQAEIQRMGHWVDVCEDGFAAFDGACLTPYSLLILDYDMPGKTGAEVVRELRAICKTVPVIILSAHAAEMIAPKLEGLELVKLLTKPVHPSELQVAIKGDRVMFAKQPRRGRPRAS